MIKPYVQKIQRLLMTITKWSDNALKNEVMMLVLCEIHKIGDGKILEAVRARISKYGPSVT